VSRRKADQPTGWLGFWNLQKSPAKPGIFVGASHPVERDLRFAPGIKPRITELPFRLRRQSSWGHTWGNSKNQIPNPKIQFLKCFQYYENSVLRFVWDLVLGIWTLQKNPASSGAFFVVAPPRIELGTHTRLSTKH
jgi:hypothetical protein